MKKLKKLFGETTVSWKFVILFAVITGVYTGLILLVPFLKDTSFQEIGVSFQSWILFAVFLIVNCRTWKEASAKCFVFFLISQPLVYLVQVPFHSMGWGLFGYYPYWAMITVLTIPGAAIAFLVKKKNRLSVAVLSVATCFLVYLGTYYARRTLFRPPHYLLSALFCFTLAVFFIFVLLDEKKHRLAALGILAAALLISVLLSGSIRTELTLPAGEWAYTMEDDSVASVKLDADGHATVTAKHDGSTYLVFRAPDGTELEYYVTVSGGSPWVDLLD